MEAFILASGLKTRFMVMVDTNGLMGEGMKGIGQITKCMARVSTHGRMEGSMMENIKVIKK
jgi:hypothetical protein